jgi:hypothetical protein
MSVIHHGDEFKELREVETSALLVLPNADSPDEQRVQKLDAGAGKKGKKRKLVPITEIEEGNKVYSTYAKLLFAIQAIVKKAWDSVR